MSEEKCVACGGTGKQKVVPTPKLRIDMEPGYRDRSGKLLDSAAPKVKGQLHATDHPCWDVALGKCVWPVLERDPELVAAGAINA